MLVGVVTALALAWGFIKLGEWLQANKGMGFSRRVAVGIGFAVGLAIWAVLKLATPLPMELTNAIAVGVGVGLAQGITRDQPKSKGQ